MSERTYIAIDLKSFYASVECVERGLDPLKTNLVVADESRTEKTICLAVTPSLKAYGLSGRSRLFEVYQKVKDIKKRTGKEITFIAAVPRMALYIEYSSRIYEIYMKYISPDDIQVYSIDEVFMDVTDYLSLYRMSAAELARTIIMDVLNTTGITATAGIAPNLYLAKVAMDIRAKHIDADSYGVRIAELDEMSYRKYLWGHKPITDFWRTGPGTAKRLDKYGMHTMGDIARMSVTNEDLLFKIFGIDAELLIDHAWGYEPCTIADIKRYKPRTNSFSSGQVLHCPYDFDKTRVVVREMTEELILDLVDKGLASGSFTLEIGYDRINVDSGGYKGEVKIDRYGRSVPKSAHGTANFGTNTSSSKKITEAVMKLFDEIVDRNLMIRRITISANAVVPEAYEQFDMFTSAEELEKEKKMQQAMISIKKRFGKNAILKGTNFEEGATMKDRNSQIGGHKA
ncbi:MAG: DNA methylase [Lachnospiraceae bacterium]|nr:DNA methylase [Lachnospiraceae bacterium]